MGGEGEGLGESHPVVEELAVSLNILRSSQLNIVHALLTHLTCGLDTHLVISIFRSIVDSVKIFMFTVKNVKIQTYALKLLFFLPVQAVTTEMVVIWTQQKERVDVVSVKVVVVIKNCFLSLQEQKRYCKLYKCKLFQPLWSNLCLSIFSIAVAQQAQQSCQEQLHLSVPKEGNKMTSRLY